MRFKLGTIVVLKSGGPDMTVESIGKNGVTCAWFVGKRLTRATLRPEMLRKTRRVSSVLKVNVINYGDLPGPAAGDQPN